MSVPIVPRQSTPGQLARRQIFEISDGRLGLGIPNPDARLEIQTPRVYGDDDLTYNESAIHLHGNADEFPRVAIYAYDGTVSGESSEIVLRRAPGTKATKANTAAGDITGSLSGRGYQSTLAAFGELGNIIYRQAGSPTANGLIGEVGFLLSNGSSLNATTEVMTLRSNSISFNVPITANLTFLSMNSGAIAYSTNTELSLTGVGSLGQVLTSNGANVPYWSTIISNPGTVTSVALTVPTGLSISGSPITSSGTLAISLTSGYTIPGGGDPGQLLTSNGSSVPVWSDAPSTDIPILIGFIINNGMSGLNAGPMLQAPRSGTLSECNVIVKSSDSGVSFEFDIKRNNTTVFSSTQTLSPGLSSGYTTSLGLLDAPVSVAAGDVFILDIIQGSEDWQLTLQLE